MKYFENSWHFITADLQHKGMLNHNYICSCGTHTVLKLQDTSSDFPNLKCKNCSNTYYVDYDRFSQKNVLFWKSLKISDKCYQDANGWHLLYYINTPSYNYTKNEVTKTKQKIFSLSLSHKGSIDKKMFDKKLFKMHIYDNHNQTIENHISKTSASLLKNFINKNISDTLEWIDQKQFNGIEDKLILDVYSFMLSNPNVKDLRLYDFDYNGSLSMLENFSNVDEALEYAMHHRKEKSIKKAVYKSYMQKDKERYSILYDYLICGMFSDSNYVVTLLDYDISLKKEIFKNYEYSFLQKIFSFLKEYYSQKQLYCFLKESLLSKENIRMFQDILQMTNNTGFLEYINEWFIKQSSTLKGIHDAVLEVYIPYRERLRYEAANKEFEYLKKEIDAQGEVDGLYYKLPTNPLELFKWGGLLRNCMGSYNHKIIKKQALIYGVFESEKLIYAINIRDEKIVEMKAFANKPVSQEVAEKIYKWFYKSDERVESVA